MQANRGSEGMGREGCRLYPLHSTQGEYSTLIHPGTGTWGATYTPHTQVQSILGVWDKCLLPILSAGLDGGGEGDENAVST